MKASKKIFCASIESERRARAYGTWDGETLVVTHILPLAGIQWREELFEESRRLAGEGFAVLIEDRTGTFSPYASPFSFDTREQDGTTSFQVSVECLPCVPVEVSSFLPNLPAISCEQGRAAMWTLLFLTAAARFTVQTGVASLVRIGPCLCVSMPPLWNRLCRTGGLKPTGRRSELFMQRVAQPFPERPARLCVPLLLASRTGWTRRTNARKRK